MNKVLHTFSISALTLGLLAWAVPTIIITSWVALGLASFVLTINVLILRPILKLVFLPITVITLGLFSLVIQAFLLWLVVYLVPGFSILPTVLFGYSLSYFWTIVVFSALISSVQSLIDILL